MFNSFPQPKPDSGGSNIKSIQNGASSIANGSLSSTVTITSVDLTKSIVRIINGGSTTATSVADEWVRVTFTSPTQLTFSRQKADGGIVNFTWEVVEFNNVKSLQRGQVSGPSAASNDVTISSVNLTKSLAFCSASTSNTLITQMGFYYRITTNTNLALYSHTAALKINEWQVIEFY